MDQVKIGRFIKECRNNKGMTQQELADKLMVSFKTVSKWECGKGLPEVALMVPLCEILSISVNDLLNGEIVAVSENQAKQEELLLEMIRNKEESDKQFLLLEVFMGVMFAIIFLVFSILALFLDVEEWVRILLVVSGTLPILIATPFLLKIEQMAGYYECGECGNKYIPTYKSVLLAAHVNRTRKMRCPKCNKKSWHKKVISK